jgi:tetratricopeptide (TPR) repeat protein
MIMIRPAPLTVILTGLIFVLSFPRLFSQTADQDMLDLIKSADDIKGKKAGAVIILKEYNSILNEKKESTLVLRVIGKIYDNRALEDYSHITLQFNSYYEDAILDHARTIRSNGSIVEVNKDAVQIKTTPDIDGNSRYTDTKFLTFALSGLEIGSAFEYEIKLVQKKSVIEGEWFDNFFMGGMLQTLTPPYIPRIDPVQTSIVKLTVPKGLYINYNLTNRKSDPVRQTKRDQDIYIWNLTDIVGLTIEAAMPSLKSLNPVLTITTLKGWNQIDQWAKDRLFKGIEIDQVVKDKAAEITLGAVSADEKTKLLLDFVRNNIRYVAADIDRGGFTPHPLQEIINSLYGDCKDQVMLFISLLKCVGIEAFPVLINPYPYEELLDVPAPNFFHLIALVPHDKDSIWLDPTSRSTPFPELSFSNNQRYAFVINGLNGKLTKTPSSVVSTASFLNNSTFGKNRSFNTVSFETSGVLSESLKTVFMSAGDESVSEFFKGLIKNYVDKTNFDSITVPGLHDLNRTFNARIYFHQDSVWSKNESVIKIASLSQIPVLLLAGLDSRSIPEKRENDLTVTPISVTSTETFSPPEKFMFPLVVPPDDSVKNDFFNYKRTFSKTNEGLTVKWHLITSQANVPAGKYNDYVTSIKKIEELSSYNIAFVEPMAFTRKLQDENPIGVLNECNELLRNDPRNIFGLLMKAIVLNQFGQRDSSISIHSRIISADPENKYAHFYISLPLFTEKRNKEAISHLETAIKIDPAFTDAYFMLGRWYDTENQYEKAYSIFRKSTETNPESPAAWRNFALFMAQRGKYRESVDYFKTAIKQDSTETDLYALMAESYMKLKSYKSAVESYRKAISLTPDEGVLYGNLAWAYYMLNDDKKCIEFSKKAIEINSSLYFACFNLAIANLRSGNITEAFRLYEDLRNKRSRIPSKQLIGGIQDLDELVSKGIHVQEANKVINSFNYNTSVYKN